MAASHRQFYVSRNASRVSLHCWHSAVSANRFHFIALHGFTGNGLDWAPLASLTDPVLDADWTAPDWCGHGHSFAPQCSDDFAHCLNAALSAVPSDRTIVWMAYSMGGRLLLQLLRSHPLWRRFPCIWIGVHPGIEDEQEKVDRRLLDARWLELLASGDMEKFADQWEQQPLLQSQNSIEPSYRDSMKARRRQLNSTAQSKVLQLSGQGVLPAAWSALPDWSQPMLWLHGQQDSKYAAIARAATALSPNACCQCVPHSGHSPHLEQPLLTAQIIQKWLVAEQETCFDGLLNQPAQHHVAVEHGQSV